MSAIDFIGAFASIDTREGMQELAEALKEIDRKLNAIIEHLGIELPPSEDTR